MIIRFQQNYLKVIKGPFSAYCLYQGIVFGVTFKNSDEYALVKWTSTDSLNVIYS